MCAVRFRKRARTKCNRQNKTLKGYAKPLSVFYSSTAPYDTRGSRCGYSVGRSVGVGVGTGVCVVMRRAYAGFGVYVLRATTRTARGVGGSICVPIAPNTNMFANTIAKTAAMMICVRIGKIIRGFRRTEQICSRPFLFDIYATINCHAV